MFCLESPGGGGYGCKDDQEMNGAMHAPPSKKARVFSATGSVADYGLSTGVCITVTVLLMLLTIASYNYYLYILCTV